MTRWARWSHKVAIVTGGASGIGAACAATLARGGAKAVVTEDDTGGQAVVDNIGTAGGEAISLDQDVSIEENWPGVIEATERRFGR